MERSDFLPKVKNISAKALHRIYKLVCKIKPYPCQIILWKYQETWEWSQLWGIKGGRPWGGGGLGGGGGRVKPCQSCQHAITRLRKIFENMRKFWTNEPQPGINGTNVVYLPQYYNFSSYFFYVIFYAWFCTICLIRAFWLHKQIHF